MKMKNMMIVSAVSAVTLWSTSAYAALHAYGDDFAVSRVIRTVDATKVADVAEGLPLTAGDKVYFDVELALDKAEAVSFDVSKYTPGATGERPRLLLNAKLKGASPVSEDVTAFDPAIDVAAQTDVAVAYWDSSYVSGTSIWNRFVYTVRPGDVIEDIDLLYSNNALVVEGKVSNLSTQVIYAGATTITSIPMSKNSFNLTTDAAATLAQEGTITTNSEGDYNYAVSGYTITVGDAGDANEAMFYKGLVPVTVSIADATALPAQVNSATTVKYSLWLQIVDQAGNVQQLPAKVTSYVNDATVVAGADSEVITPVANFDATYAATAFVAPKVAGYSQRFYVSLPEGVVITDTDTVRVCYGVDQTNANYKHLYGYALVDVQSSPVAADTNTSGYDLGVMNPAAMSAYDLAAADVMDNFVGTGADDVVAAGATKTISRENGDDVIFIAAPASSKTSITIDKNALSNLATYGTLYAYIEQVTKTTANVTPDSFIVPLKYGAALHTVTFTARDNATNATAVYRVRIPGLAGKDKPFYIVIQASPRQEEIRIDVDATGGAITEYYTPAEIPANGATANPTITKFTANFLTNPVNNATRYFLVHPVFSDGRTEITEDYYLKDLVDENDQPLSVLSVLRKVAQVQTSPNGVAMVTGDGLRLRLPVSNGVSSADFYVVALNNFALETLQNATILQKQLDGTMKEVALTVPGPLFAVRSCNTANVITGTADICDTVASVSVNNRAPQVTTYSAPGSTTLGATVPFTFNVVDVKSDYIVAEMVFDATDTTAREYRLIANEADMIAQMGAAAWAAKITELETKYAAYGVATGDFALNGARRVNRTSTETSLAFSHTYQNEGDKNWEFNAYDSSNAYVTVKPTGTIEITSAQKFTFNVVNIASRPGLGYVLWSKDGDTEAAQQKWDFEQSTTTAALARNSGTIASVIAVPFAAGGTNASDTFGKLTAPSATHDSFFYKWAASNDYAALLPDGTDPAQTVYTPVLHITRAFTVGGAAGGGADSANPDTWSDVILSAIFSAERFPGDALEAYDMLAAPAPNMWSLGDYNQDNVPDGWLIHSFADEAYAMIEGPSVATASAEGDALPIAGWDSADTAYYHAFRDEGLQGSLMNPWTLAVPLGPVSAGNVFSYAARVRGLDSALNAADGNGNWLSAPAWRVMLRPTVEIDQNGVPTRYMNVGAVNAEGVYTSSDYEAHNLYMGSLPVDTARTARHRVPYATGNVQVALPAGVTFDFADWRYVLNEAGVAMNNANCPGHNVIVNINPDSPNYEEILDIAACGWRYSTVEVDPANDQVTTVYYKEVEGVPFPFTDAASFAAEIAAATARDPHQQFVVTNLGGAVNADIDQAYHFVDWRVPAGILIDEAFAGTDPRNTSWLSRYAGNNADANANGVNNGMEYYFWYYASRIAFSSVYDVTDVDGARYTQVNTALWPAIDIIHNADGVATDARYGTQQRFVMGRAYNNEYNPDAPVGSYASEEASTEAAAQGNYWNPIPVETILSHFAPAGGNSGALAASDLDNDGLSTAEEIALGTNPIDCDTDNDWIIDGWEAQWAVDTVNPLNPADAIENPDRDFFARALVFTFPEAHQLYKLDCATLPTGAQAAFYDTTDACIRYAIYEADLVTDTVLEKEDFLPKTLVWADRTNADMANINDVDTTTVYTYMVKERVTIRHKEVYKTFGFSPFTGWNDDHNAVNTAEFTNVEEFNTFVRENFEVNPSLDDTNGDTIPDGWSLYTGIDPIAVVVDVPDTDEDGVTDENEYAHDADGKPYPSDPGSPDTDLDGVGDAQEIASGMNPCSMDSDGDLIADGYEYLWRGEEGPNPLDPNDYDMDFDGDGLSTYHEYMTGLFRHFRYDLSPAASRIYKGTRGKLSDADGSKWESFPDLYNVYEDLLNPSEMVSMDYYATLTEAEEDGEADALAPLYIHPLKSALAKVGAANDGHDALQMALMSIWTRSIVVPTADQISARVQGIDEIITFLTALNSARVYLAAADRIISGGDMTPEMASAAHHAIGQVDAFFAADYDVALTAVNELALLKSYQEGAKVWKVRREMMAALVDNYYADAPGSLKLFMESLNTYRKEFQLTELAVVDRKPATLTKAAYPAQVYETLFNGAGRGNDDTLLTANNLTVVECPLLQAQYRTALRGFTGGIWADRTEILTKQGLVWMDDVFYFAPIAYHMALKPLHERTTANAPYVLGMSAEQSLNGQLVTIGSPEEDRQLFSTSPVLADSDADGMDDYWEVFHGLNPMLGDYVNLRNEPDTLKNGHAADLLTEIYTPRVKDVQYVNPAAYYIYTPEDNAFGNLAGAEDDVFGFKAGKVTGFDYYTIPWFSGVPFADADGDALLNYTEAVNPEDSATLYGTDPSALWMTDPNNENSFVSRFYTLRNIAEKQDAEGANVDASIKASYPSFMHPDVGGYVVKTNQVFPIFPFEVNEGYDTDGDGLGDITEAISANGNYNGDPQSAVSPNRNFSAYLGGEGAMQSAAMVEFGPTALSTFTVECWVCPDGNAPDGEMVLVDRPWSAGDKQATPDLLRHNFVLGLKREGGKTYPYAFYTGAGTVEEGTSTTVPAMSPRVQSTNALETVDENGVVTNAGVWSHVAVAYDGAALTLYINGKSVATRTSTLVPANGVISFVNSEAQELPPVTYTYRKAPILIGATPKENWFAEMGDILAEANKQATPVVKPTAWSDYYQKCYKGYIDEVRIWDRARTAEEIASNYQKAISLDDLVLLRLNAMMDRLGYVTTNNGVYEDDVRSYPVAIYSFDDLLSSTKTAPDTLFEQYPGQKLVGDETTPGSFLYRRPVDTALKACEELQSLAAGNMKSEFLPTAEELYTSYYAIQTPEVLKSTKYKDSDYEYIPKALNKMSHLPRFDIDLAEGENSIARRKHLLASTDIKENNGNPWLTSVPMVDAYKMLDTFFWRNGYAGWNLKPTVTLKANWNPYGYRYLNAPEFDQDTHTVKVGYLMVRPTDLMVYGDAYGRYPEKNWNPDAPTTDPSKGDPATNGVEGTPHWFEHNDKNADTGSNINDKQFSVGGEILENEVAMGQTNDRDEDRMPDWWELYYGLNPEDATMDNGAFGDGDGDFLTNYAEFLAPSNPKMYSTAGNGIPDFHVPLYYRRGAPIMGLLYSDADFMEDHWEHALAKNSPSVDAFDMYADPDQDGWSNYAEARVSTRGNHSTDPNAKEEQDLLGTVAAYPTPAISIQIDYFGDNAALFPEVNEPVEGGDEDAPVEEEITSRNIVIHTFTAVGNQSAPDAIFVLPMAAAEEDGEDDAAEGARTQMAGRMNFGTTKGYLEPGNIKAGSVNFKTAYYQEIGPDGQLNGFTESDSVSIRDDGKGNLKAFEPPAEEGGEPVETVTWIEKVIGSINYTTGAYTYTIDPADYASNELYDADGNFIAYFEDVFLNATYDTVPVKTLPATFTFSQPVQGHIREGKNNFFVFLDLNGNNLWNAGEPAGVPDQHDVDIGYDTINRQLRVTLTELAPPGSVRVDIQSILDTFKEEKLAAEEEYNNQDENEDNGDDNNNNNNGGTENSIDTSSVIKNPITGNNVYWPYIVGGLNEETPKNYQVILFFWKADDENGTMNGLSYSQALNISKPYITEDEIFAANPAGLDASEENAPGIASMKYVVCLVPEDAYDTALQPDALLRGYAVGTVVNNCGVYDRALTKLCAPETANLTGGKIVNNTDLAISWECTTQVPTFDLQIVKTHNAAGQELPTKPVIFSKKGIRGVSACASVVNTSTTSITPVYKYTYELPNIIGELNADGTALCGNGAYSYTLTLRPFSGDPAVLEGTFAVQLNDSREIDGDTIGTVETYLDTESNTYKAGALDTSFNAYNSYYVRANIRYNGVLKQTKDFRGGLLRVEAHRSASFNGTPVASTSDRLVYDSENEAVANLNHCVIMEKVDPYKNAAGEEIFFSTRFRTEIRGLSSNEPVYLMAYLDLNKNGKRDTWEPWGYLAKGRNNEVQGYYYDPVCVTPTGASQTVTAEFYIQDVDTDNDKLADAWEWKSAGYSEADFANWCNTFSGFIGEGFVKSGVLWTSNSTGVLSLTAFGAQVYGVDVIGTPDAQGTVKTAIDQQLADVSVFADILSGNSQLALALEGYTAYELGVESISFDGEDVTIAWGLSAENAAGETTDVTTLIANKASNAKYVVYGSDSLNGEWAVVAEGTFDAATTDATLNLATVLAEKGIVPAFFKVVIGVAE